MAPQPQPQPPPPAPTSVPSVAPRQPRSDQPEGHETGTRTWFYTQGTVTRGPVSTAELRRLYKRGQVRADTMVHLKGVSRTWTRLVRRPELTDLVDWYYYPGAGGRHGPVKTARMLDLLEAGSLHRRVRIWRRGLDKPAPLESQSPFAGLLRTSPRGRADALAAAADRRKAPPPGPDASSGRVMIGRTDLASSAYVESHLYAADKFDGVAGRMLLGVRLWATKRVTLGLEAVLPWFAPSDEHRDGDVLFGNLALRAGVRIAGDERFHVSAGLKLHLPTMTDIDGSAGRTNVQVSLVSNFYEPGFYMYETLTVRPDIRLFKRAGGFVIAAEVGLGLLFHVGDDLTPAHLGHLHTGMKLGYVTPGGTFFAYWELGLAKLFELSASDGGGSTMDLPAQLMTGPGVKLQLRRFEFGLALVLPVTEALTNVLDLSVAMQAGVRW
jgi:GYF domain 2